MSRSEVAVAFPRTTLPPSHAAVASGESLVHDPPSVSYRVIYRRHVLSVPAAGGEDGAVRGST